MQSFITLTLFSTLSALTAAVPHARNHYHLHEARALHRQQEAGAVKLTPVIAERSPVITYQLSPIGTCGGETGYQCAPGSCCSQWGYCGNGTAYCGGGSPSNSTGTSLSASAYSPPAYTAPVAPSAPAYSLPASVAPVSSSAPAAPPAYSPPSSSAAAPTTLVPSISAPAPSAYSPPASSYSASAPSSSSTSGGSGTGLGNTYKMYNGNGDASTGWPTQNEWMEFEDLWSANEDTINISCAEFGEANNSPSETADVKSAIKSVSMSAGIDPRFVLAVMMQESKGCVRVPTTNYGNNNPGLLQSDNGKGTCNAGAGQAQNPCPSSEITQMITDGVVGDVSGDTALQPALSQAGCNDVSKYYKAARIYNSGSVAAGGDLGAGVATHCYSSDIANRLTGWTTAECSCTLDGGS